MILDITFINDAVFGNNSNSLSVARAGRAARVGTRAGRIVRILKVLRVLQQYKKEEERKRKQQELEEKRRLEYERLQRLEEERNKDLIQYKYEYFTEEKNQFRSDFAKKLSQISSSELPKSQNISLTIDSLNSDESNLSKVLQERSTIKVIIKVLILMLVLPYFNQENSFKSPNQIQFLLSELQFIAQSNQNTQQNMKLYWQNVIQININSKLNIIEMGYPPIDEVYLSGKRKDELRQDEQNYFSTIITIGKYKNQQIYAITNSQNQDQLGAIIGIIKTIFISIVLTLANMTFNNDVNSIILNDIIRLLKIVKEIAKNPLTCKDNQIIKKQEQENDDEDNYKKEAQLIENTVTKIGILLAHSYGEIGCEIISNNIAVKGELNLMMPGKKTTAIFGYIYIQNFSDVSEALQEEVLLFVNSIADLVHARTEKYQGRPNQNFFDLFLLIWQANSENYIEWTDEPNNIFQVKKNIQLKNIFDLSLISFLKIIVGVKKKASIAKYNKNINILNIMPEYNIDMKFTLHFGWAIESIVGSNYKIDTLYLSPEVNFCKKMLDFSNDYGVQFIISSNFYNCLSKQGQKICRQIDQIKYKNIQYGIYTVNYELKYIKEKQIKVKNKSKFQEYQNHQFSKFILKQLITSIQEKAKVLFHYDDKDLPIILEKCNSKFNKAFKQAFKYFIDKDEKDWVKAKQLLDICHQIKFDDGPTLFLLQQMKENKFQCPEQWQGYRNIY